MACFVVPAGEALLVSAVRKVVERKVKKGEWKVDDPGYTRVNALLRKSKWLSNLLWGGSTLLAFEHVWHGEIVPWFPFLTAAYSAEGTAEMLREMATVGVTMAAVISLVWVVMVLVSIRVEKGAVQKDLETSL